MTVRPRQRLQKKTKNQTGFSVMIAWGVGISLFVGLIFVGWIALLFDVKQPDTASTQKAAAHAEYTRLKKEFVKLSFALDQAERNLDKYISHQPDTEPKTH